MDEKRIIPCLDMDEGRVVKGVKFEGIVDIGDPVEVALRYQEQGAKELTMLDIGASSKGRRTQLDVVQRVAEAITIPLCVGGGIRSLEDVQRLLDVGVKKVSVSSAALDNPQLLSAIARAFGSSTLVLSIDAKGMGRDEEGRPIWHVFSKGGKIDTGREVAAWALLASEQGVGEILVNSIDTDGMGGGYDLPLLRWVKQAVSLPVIASSGAGSLEQIAAGLLPPNPKEADGGGAGADAALVASMLHFGKTTIGEIKEYLTGRGVKIK